MKLKTVIILFLLYVFCFRTTFDYGYCYNNNGDGIVLNPITNKPVDDYYNYINYGNGLNGNYILTICVLNPLNNYDDDIIYRYDLCVKNTNK